MPIEEAPLLKFVELGVAVDQRWVQLMRIRDAVPVWIWIGVGFETRVRVGVGHLGFRIQSLGYESESELG